MTNSVLYSVLDFFRGSLTSRENLFVSKSLFVWLKLSEEEELESELEFKGKEDIAEQFERFFYETCDGYNLQFDRQLNLNDEPLYELVEKVKKALDKKLISYEKVAEAFVELASKEKSFGFILVPNELVDLGTNLLTGGIEDVYCPFESSYRFAESLSLQGCKAYIEQSDFTTLAWIRMSAELRGVVYHQEWITSNPIKDPIYLDETGLRQFSHSISMPPFGVKYPKKLNDIFNRFPENSFMGEVLQIRHMLAQTKCQVVVFVMSSILSRTAAGEKQFKQSVIKDGWLNTVIALPAKLLNNTPIEINALVFNKSQPTNEVRFIDASTDHFYDATGKVNKLTNFGEIIELANNRNIDSEYSSNASYEDIEANEFNILPSRYVLSKDLKALNKYLQQHHTKPLEEIATLITPQAIKDEPGGDITFHEYGLTHLNNIGELEGDGRLTVTTSHASRAAKQVMKAGDVLIANKGSIGKVALVDEQIKEYSIPSQAYTIVRLHPYVEGITPYSLFQYLISSMGQVQLNALCTGAIVSMIGNKDLKAMKIPIFTQNQLEKAEQTRTCVKTLNGKISEIKNEINQLNQSHWLN